jgi:PAS domain S-box-containing protein
VIGTVRDITARKQAAEELAQRTAELEAIFAAQNDAIFVCDTEMNVYRANPAFHAIYGFDPVGMNVKDIAQRTSSRWLDGRPFVWEQQPTPRALRGEKVTGSFFQITRADGAQMMVNASSGPLFVGDSVAGAVTVWHDVTARQRAEEALFLVRTQHEDKLRQTAKIIGKVLDERMQETAEIIRRVLDDVGRAKADHHPDAPSLTIRETEVLTLLAEGKSSKAIADRLFISVHTVNRHRANIMDKLEIRKTVDLVKYAISQGFVAG